jgi:hypothetical protein
MINIELAKAKGLITDNDNLYKELEKKYKYILEYYLNTIIDFSIYENMISSSNLYIGKNKKYQDLNEYLKLDYLFFINNLFIEKLDDNNLTLLKNFNKDNITDEVVNMIKNTYSDVIKDNYFKENYTDQIYKVCYGPVVPINFVDNNSLVFRFIYGKNLIDLNGDEFFELDKKQKDFINEVIDKLKNEIFDKTGLKTEVLITKDIY